MNRTRTGLAVGAALLLTAMGCRGLSEAAKKVRVYQAQADVASCRNLGEVSAHATGWGEKYKADAVDDAREKAVELGGDSVIVLEHSSGFSGHLVKAGVFQCDARTSSTAASSGTSTPEEMPSFAMAKDTSVLVLEFKMLDGEQRVGKIFTSLLSAQLAKIENLNVLSPEDLQATIQMERQKDLLGCDDVSCLAEIAGAMGTSLILHGSVGSIGSKYAVNASLFDGRLGKARSRVSHTVAKNEDALVDAVDDVFREIATQMSE